MTYISIPASIGRGSFDFAAPNPNPGENVAKETGRFRFCPLAPGMWITKRDAERYGRCNA
jgi:hypothetical protein